MIRSLGVPDGVAEAIETIVRSNARRDTLERERRASNASRSIGQVARHFHRKCLERASLLDGLLNDPSWHMLLALVADEEAGRPVHVSELCINSGGPPTTALRHLDRMHEMGLIERHDDPRDQRRVFVSLTEGTRVRLHQFLRECCVAPPLAN